MRPRSMTEVPGLDGIQDPFGRFKRFASMILAVPKDEADKEGKRAAARAGKRLPRGRRIANGRNKP